MSRPAKATMTTVLVVLLIYTGADQPVKGAWVEVEGMVKTGYVVEQVTDARGVFVVEIEPGSHQVSVTKPGYVPFSGQLPFTHNGSIGIRLDPVPKPLD